MGLPQGPVELLSFSFREAFLPGRSSLLFFLALLGPLRLLFGLLRFGPRPGPFCQVLPVVAPCASNFLVLEPAGLKPRASFASGLLVAADTARALYQPCL